MQWVVTDAKFLFLLARLRTNTKSNDPSLLHFAEWL